MTQCDFQVSASVFISTPFLYDSEANASELLKNHEEMIPLRYMYV